jgi:hypothetical protein
MAVFTKTISVRQIIRACLLFLLPLALPLAPECGSTAEQATRPETILRHGPVSSTSAGKSVPVSVVVSDPLEIFEVRLYFKTMSADKYLFISMTGSSKGEFTAELPPAKNDTRGLDYILLFKNSRGEVRKTKPFRLLVLNDYTLPPPSPALFEVLTEHDTGAEENTDFGVPLKLSQTPEPLLAYAVEDPSMAQTISGTGDDKNILNGFSGLSGVSFSVKIGGFGFFYKGFSSH